MGNGRKPPDPRGVPKSHGRKPPSPTGARRNNGRRPPPPASRPGRNMGKSSSSAHPAAVAVACGLLGVPVVVLLGLGVFLLNGYGVL
jgi:hypothetical protein